MKINKHKEISEYDLDILQRKAELSDILYSTLMLTKGDFGLSTAEVSSVIKEVFTPNEIRVLKNNLINKKRKPATLLKG